MVEDGAFSPKIDLFQFFGESKYQRASKSHYWFKSYGDFVEWEDFAYWWSSSSGGYVINGAYPVYFLSLSLQQLTIYKSWANNLSHSTLLFLLATKMHF